MDSYAVIWGLIGIIFLFWLISRLKTKNKRIMPKQDLLLQVAARDGAWCRYCGAKENLEIDHIKPVAKFGLFSGNYNDIRNLQILCRTCNRRKSDKYQELSFRT